MPVASLINSFIAVEGGQTFPTVEDLLTQAFSSDTTSHNVNMPATVDAGDLLIIFFSCNEDLVVTDPSGWTRLYRDGTTIGGVTGVCLLRDADGTEDGASYDVQTASAQAAAAQVYRIKNWSGDINDVEVGSRFVSSSGGTSSPDPPSVTASWGADKNLFIAFVHGGDDDATVDAAPSDYTNLTSVVSGAGTNAGCEVGTARRALQASNDNPSPFTLSETEGVVTGTVVVRPAA